MMPKNGKVIAVYASVKLHMVDARDESEGRRFAELWLENLKNDHQVAATSITGVQEEVKR
jgi:hypothetical protein